uniref:DnaJ homolog subfamily C member 11 n=1 Tax=Amphiprion ocellaris TaxID=80972 RepID=A0AAQ5Z9I1_AMPOC
MAASLDDEFEFNNQDYYSLLNVRKEATLEELKASYRRLCMLYHPDKHRDPELKRQAEQLFNQVHQAYEVLSDAHSRAIYDIFGKKGLEVEGWEVVERKRTPAEIREEYERLQREREERRLQQRTNPKGTISVGVDATDLFDRYDEDFEEMPGGGFPHIEINKMHISQSIEAPLTNSDTAVLSGSLSTHNGNGGGNINMTLLPSAVFYATVGPLLVYMAIHRLVIIPYTQAQKEQELELQRKSSATDIAKKKQEAESAVLLMQESVRRIIEAEESKMGLIILNAWYGKFVSDTSQKQEKAKVIDVTVPLQCLVKDSKLILTETSKAGLPGFYDPCVGEEKSLKLLYQFRGVMHQVISADTEPLRIPKQSHRIESES